MATMASSDSEEDYGMIQPTLIRQLRTILDQYPDDGQILKELIQNAEDAGATEVKILYDENEYPTRKLHDREMSKFQGPALLAYNNALFDEKDWKGIRQLQDSIKEKDPMKVGRFGLGFKSVLHITDLPSVLSLDRLFMIDPHERYFYCKRQPTSGYTWHFQRRSERIEKAADHFTPFVGMFGVTQETFTKGFNGTLFRFPLRREPSDLSETIYDAERVSRLLESFKQDAHMLLLFLRNIESIAIYKKHKGSREAKPTFEVKIAKHCLDDVRKNRCELQSAMKSERHPPEGNKLTHLLTVQLLTYNKDGRIHSTTEHIWLITQYLAGSGISTELKELCNDPKLSLVPLVGAAMAIDKSQQDRHKGKKDGQVFCFLPLPMEQRSSTGLPVHVNGYFAISQNRRHLKWPTAGQDIHSDRSIHWNHCVLKELIPVVYAELLSQAALHFRKFVCPQDVYYAMPDTGETDEKWRAVHGLYNFILQQPVFKTSTRGGRYERIDNVLFDTLDVDEHDRTIITSVMSDCNSNIVRVPLHVLTAISEYYPNFKTLTPSTVRTAIRKYPGSYCNRPETEQLELLKFVLQDNQLTDMEEIVLLPRADHKLVRFQRHGDAIYIPTLDIHKRLFSTLNHCLLSDNLEYQLMEKLKTMANKGWYQLQFIRNDSAVELIRRSLPSEWKKQEIVDGEKYSLSLDWFSTLWEYMRSEHPYDIGPFEGLHIIPFGNSKKLLPLSRSCPIILKNAHHNQLDSHLARMLEMFGAHVIDNVPQFVLGHSMVLYNSYINVPQPDDVMRLICTCFQTSKCQQKLISNMHLSLSTAERSAFLKFACKVDTHLMEEIRSILQRFPVFPSNQTNHDAIAYVAPDRVSEAADLRGFPGRISRTLINISQEYEIRAARLLQVKWLEHGDVIKLVLGDIRSGHYDSKTVQYFMEFIFNNFGKYANDGNLLALVCDTPFVTCGEPNPKKPNQLYDPEDEYIKKMFSQENGVFPTGRYAQEHMIAILRKLGLKSFESFTATEALDIMNQIHKHPSREDNISKSKSLFAVFSAQPKILQEEIRGQQLFQHASTLSWVTISSKKPQQYPSTLRWKGADSNNTARPLDVKVAKYASLIGSVCVLLESSITTNTALASLFSWDSEPDLKDIIAHLQHVIEAYVPQEKSAFLSILNEIYSRLLGFDKTNLLKEVRRAALREWVWHGDGFTSTDSIFVQQPHINLVPHIYTLPSEMKQFQTLFTECGMKEQCDCDGLVSVLEQINNSTQSDDSNARRNLQQAVDVLNYMTTQGSSMSETTKMSVLVPVLSKTSDMFDMANIKDCSYSDEPWILQDFLTGEKTDIQLVHSDLPLTTAKRLGVPSLKSQMIPTEELAITGCGQGEPLTVRLKNILDDYTDGLPIFNEMIQNADDAGATEINFLYDERRNENYRKSLLDPAMQEWQGPALWIHNDAQFSDNDFANITRLGGATKDSEKIGKFGLGFNVVYHMTDIPSFVSKHFIVIFDPHQKYLEKALKDPNQPGIKIDLRKRRPKLTDQFKPYQGIFGCKIDDQSSPSYDATLFRIPLRSKQQAVTSEISQMIYNRVEVYKLFHELTEHAHHLLLFTRHLQKIRFYHLDEQGEVSDIELIFEVDKNEFDRHLSNIPDTIPNLCSRLGEQTTTQSVIHITTQTEYNNKTKTNFSGQSIPNESKHWLVSEYKESNEVTMSASHHFLLGGIAMLLKPVEQGFIPIALNEAVVFCFLPLPVVTGLPVHVNGTFSVPSNRGTLCRKTIGAKDDSKAQWNETIFRGVVLKAYLQCLEPSRFHGTNEDINLHEVWPSHHVRDDAKPLFDAFFDNSNFLRVPFSICGGLALTLQNVIFFNFEDMPSDVSDAVKYTFEIVKEGHHIVAPVDNVVKSLVIAKHKDLVSDLSFDMARFLSEIFLPNISRIDPRTRDILTIYFILKDRKELDQCLHSTACIPVSPMGKHLKLIRDLIDPRGEIAKLFTTEDGRFPYRSFATEDIILRLKTLGLQTDQLSWEDLIDRAKTVKDEFKKSNNAGQTRTRLLLKYINLKISWNLTERDHEAIETLRSIDFVKVLEKPDRYPVQWAADSTNVLWCPKDLYAPNLVKYVSATEGMADTDSMSTALQRCLKFKTEVTPDHVKHQLLAVLNTNMEHFSKSEYDCESHTYDLYKFLDNELSENHDIAGILSEIRPRACVSIGNRFVEPSCVAFNDEVTCTPYLYSLPLRMTQRYRLLMTEFGVKEKFNKEDFMLTINKIADKWKKNRLHSSDLKSTIVLLNALCEDMKKENVTLEQLKDNLGNVYVPNADGILSQSDTLCFDDCPWIKRGDWNLLYSGIPLVTAEALGVRTKKDKILLKHGHGIPFGQKERLTKSLKRNLQNFSSHYDVLKELIQNADDAGATCIHFVRDCQKHKTDRLLGESWAPLQGPALCVYNNRPFTEIDLGGIQQFGEGSKQADSCKTGQYGIGFSSVYHLTDVPSILTSSHESGNILCVFDPNCKYVPGATSVEPGMKYVRAEEMKIDFPNVFSCYHEDKFDLKNGTMFRLPLRTSYMGSTSKISDRVISIDTIWDLFEELKTQICNIFLFLNNIEEIRISDIDSSGKLRPLYAANISLSEQDKFTRRQFADSSHTYSFKMKNAMAGLAEIPRSKYIYNLEITDTEKRLKRFCVAQTLGFSENIEIPDDVQSAHSDGTLRLMPRGGVACCLNNTRLPVPTTGKVYCFLPLDKTSGLPVHVNAHFALGHENRRHVWHKKQLETFMQSWNELLCETVVAESYASLLEETKKYLIDEIHQTIKQVDILKCISQYVSCFPTHSEAKAEWHILVDSIYKTVAAHGLPIFPVINYRGDSVKWCSAKSDTEHEEAFFCKMAPEPVSEATQKSALSLKEILKACNVSIIDVPLKVVETIEKLAISENSFVTPDNIIRVLGTYDSEHPLCCIGHLPQNIENTPFKDIFTLNTVIKFCKRDDTFLSRLNGLPLLLKGDHTLESFDSTNPILDPTYAIMFPKHGHEFISWSIWPHVSKGTECGGVTPFRKLELPKFVELVQEEFPKIVNVVSVEWSNSRTSNKHEDMPLPNWIEECWGFIHSQVKPTETSSNENTTIKKMLLPLRQMCLIPVTVQCEDAKHNVVSRWALSMSRPNVMHKTFLYPLERAEDIFYHHKAKGRYDLDRLRECLESLGVPQLDVTVFQLSHFTINTLECIVSTLENPSRVLQMLHRGFSESQSAPSVTVHVDFLLQYFQKHLDEFNEKHKEYISHLPLYETVSGQIVSLEKYKARYTIPDEIPEDGLDFFQKNQACDMIFLKEKGNLVDLHEFLGCFQNSVVKLYCTFIFPHFEYFTDSQCKTHLKYLYDRYLKHEKLEDQKECDRRELINEMQSLPIFKDTQGTACLASELSDPRNPVFKLMLTEADFPPPLSKNDHFTKHDWYSLLRTLGMVTVMSKAQCIKFAQTIAFIGERSKSDKEKEKIKQMSTVLVKNLFEMEENTRNDILPHIKEIQFLVQHQVSRDLTSLCQQFSKNTQACMELIAFKNSVPRRCQKFVWTSANLLSDAYCPGGKEIYRLLEVDEHPDVSTVVEHLVHLCDRISNSDGGIRDTGLISDIFEKIYQYLAEQNLRGVKDILMNTPVVLVKDDTVLVRARQISINLTERTEIRPYLYKIPLTLGRHANFFKIIGTTDEPTAQQYAEVLQTIYSHTANRQLPPSYTDFVFRAISGFYESAKRSGVDGVEHLFLPNEAGYLRDSIELIFNDSPAFYQRVRDSNLPFVVDLRDCGIDARHSDEIFQDLPKHLQPRLLSNVVQERLTERSRSQMCESRTAQELEQKLHTYEFSKAIKRLVLHEGKTNGQVITDADLAKIFERLTITHVRNVSVLETELIIKDKIIPRSKMQKMCCLEKENSYGIEQWIIYINNVQTVDSDILIPFCELLNEVLQGKLGKSVLYLLPIFKCDKDDIETKLDSFNIGLDQSQSISSVSLAIALGSKVDPKWPLQDGRFDIEVGEIVAYKHRAGKIYARISSCDGNGKYSMNDGYVTVSVHANNLSKFVL